MKYQTERIEDIAQSQTLLAELFSYIGEHYDQNAQLRPQWQHFFQVWAGQTPYTKIKVFTAREEGKIQGCVMVLVMENPLFVTKPFIQRFIDLTQGDKDFDDYVKIVLDSL
ncbi:hypothetical protein BKG95_02300 [Rodentibacter pneumotropicus]|uniref:GNAT family N-acetyltransferase n=1 Tax=Rodentibacter pneumotropicus TaxID=758 RepID=A0AAW5LA79_9PAST|nr:hypothetical protein [Rodentibacter pneumotropicus]MCQ9120945.1 hypothetical protein [Rodentibacter pneumotropicus]OOF69116.1 hypothetical protein BKG95_02300 [Rodentibacter pneumotropicus]